MLTLHVTRELLDLSAADFFHQVVQQRLSARAMVEGPNFCFGHNREGTIETLTTLCHEAGIALSVVPPLVVEGAEVSSSRIRGELLRGEVAAAARLLGRPYRLAASLDPVPVGGAPSGFPLRISLG